MTPPPLDQLVQFVKTKYPQATVSVTAPLHDGVWFMDVACDATQLAIEWGRNPLDCAFSVSKLDAETTYGEGPDAAFKSLDDAQRYITDLITRDKAEAPP